MNDGGEGGMVTTLRRTGSSRPHGRARTTARARVGLPQDHPPGFRWVHDGWGTNLRMTEMQAAIGRHQLRLMLDWHARRSHNAGVLAQGLAGLAALTIPIPDAPVRHAWYRFYALLDVTALRDDWSRDRVPR